MVHRYISWSHELRGIVTRGKLFAKLRTHVYDGLCCRSVTVVTKLSLLKLFSLLHSQVVLGGVEILVTKVPPTSDYARFES